MIVGRPWLIIALVALAAAGERPLHGADPVRALGEQLHLQGAGETAKCGLPLTAYVMDHAGDTRLLHGVIARAFLLRPVTQTDILRGRFRIHFDTTGVHEPAMLDAAYRRIPGSFLAYAESIAAIADTVYEAETGRLGYPAAPPDQGMGGGDEYDIYIQSLDSLGYYGRTVPENSAGPRRSTTYMEIDNDFSFVTPDTLKGLPAARVTLAHEYHHAIQLGDYGYWGFDNISYYEMTSVWLEDAVFPDVNDYFSYLRSSQGHFRHPEVEFTSPDFIVYSRGIWCHYLARRFSPDIIRLSWELIGSSPPLDAMEAALQQSPYASSFKSAFAEWTLWNFFTGRRSNPDLYYPEGAWYPEIITRVTGFNPPSLSITDAIPPLSARYQQVLFHADTLTLALANVDLASAQAGDAQPVSYAYLLNIEQPDDTYKPTQAGLFVRLDAEDLSSWYSWDIVNGGVRPSPLEVGLPFPNPYRPEGGSSVSIPVPLTSPVNGTLTIFTVDMNRVYRAEEVSSLLLGNYVFGWNGKADNGESAQTGIYIFVLELPDRRFTGKIALIRN